MAIDNINPTIYKTSSTSRSKRSNFLECDTVLWGSEDSDSESDSEPLDSREVFGAHESFLHSLCWDIIIDTQTLSVTSHSMTFWDADLIRSITDPEHPLTLEQLAVVSEPQITVKHGKKPFVQVEFTPTIPHCSMATLIGLSLRVRLMRSLPERFKVDIKVREGSHQSENAINKQLNDKERVAAALENDHLLGVVQQCLSSAGRRGAL